MKIHNSINFNSQIWEENGLFVAYSPRLEVASCGETIEKAKKNLKEAVNLFLEEAQKMGTLDKILEEAGFLKNKKVWRAPKLISLEEICLPIKYA